MDTDPVGDVTVEASCLEILSDFPHRVQRKTRRAPGVFPLRKSYICFKKKSVVSSLKISYMSRRINFLLLSKVPK